MIQRTSQDRVPIIEQTHHRVIVAVVGAVTAVALEVLAVLAFLGVLPGINTLAGGLLLGGGLVIVVATVVSLTCKKRGVQNVPQAPIPDLPKNVLQTILSHIPQEELITTGVRVCKQWKHAIEGDLMAPHQIQGISRARAKYAVQAPLLDQPLGIPKEDLPIFSVLRPFHFYWYRPFYYELALRRIDPERRGSIHWTEKKGSGCGSQNLTQILRAYGNNTAVAEVGTLLAHLRLAETAPKHSFVAAKKFADTMLMQSAYFLVAKSEVKFHPEAAQKTLEKITNLNFRTIASSIIKGTLGAYKAEFVPTLLDLPKDVQTLLMPDLIAHWGITHPKEMKKLIQASAITNKTLMYGALACLDPSHDMNDVPNSKSLQFVLLQALFDTEGAQRAAEQMPPHEKALVHYFIACIETSGAHIEGPFSKACDTAFSLPDQHSSKAALIYRFGLTFVDHKHKSYAEKVCLNKLDRKSQHYQDLKQKIKGNQVREEVYATLFNEEEFELCTTLSWLGQKLFEQKRWKEGKKVMNLVSHLAVDAGLKANVLLDFSEALEKHKFTPI